MSDMEKLLKHVGRKVSLDVGSYDEEFQNSITYRSLVEYGVLSLLEAGEALANSKTRNDFNEAVNVWDAALRKAMEL